MYISFREKISNEWNPKAVSESCADWLKFEVLSNRDHQGYRGLRTVAPFVTMSNQKFTLCFGNFSEFIKRSRYF